MISKEDLQLGKRVRFRNALVRKRLTYRERRWEPGEHAAWREGVIVGVRTLGNGSFHWEDGYLEMWFPERFEAVLISFDLRKRPVYARFEDLEVPL